MKFREPKHTRYTTIKDLGHDFDEIDRKDLMSSLDGLLAEVAGAQSFHQNFSSRVRQKPSNKIHDEMILMESIPELYPRNLESEPKFGGSSSRKVTDITESLPNLLSKQSTFMPRRISRRRPTTEFKFGTQVNTRRTTRIDPKHMAALQR